MISEHLPAGELALDKSDLAAATLHETGARRAGRPHLTATVPGEARRTRASVECSPYPAPPQRIGSLGGTLAAAPPLTAEQPLQRRGSCGLSSVGQRSQVVDLGDVHRHAGSHR